jgi:tubulin beta
MSDSDPKYGRILTGSVLFRGETVSGCEVDQQIKKISDKYSQQFVEWIPNRVMSSICSVSPPYRNSSMSGTMMLNTTSINGSLRKVLVNFEKMYKRKAFVHWYTNEGMDIQEFEEAQANLNDLISEYQQYADAGSGEDDEEMEYVSKGKINASALAEDLTTTATSKDSHHEDEMEFEME